MDVKIEARPWQPQDLIDDLQNLINEEPDNYLNTRRSTLCMARDYLKEHFAEQKWISVKDRLPSIKKMIDGEEYMKTVAVRVEGCEVEKIAYYDCEENRWFGTDDFPIFEKVTHWYELPEWNSPQPPKDGEV